MEGLIARGTQRFSRLSLRLSCEWNFQSRKTLRKFFKSFPFKCFGGWTWRLICDLIQSRKSRVLHKNGQFLNLFSFPSNISNYSSSSLPETLSNSPRHSRTNLDFCIISSSNLKGKGLGFLFLTSYLLIMVLFSCFVSYLRFE